VNYWEIVEQVQRAREVLDFLVGFLPEGAFGDSNTYANVMAVVDEGYGALDTIVDLAKESLG